MLLAAFVAQAQIKIAPKLENGFKTTYTEVQTTSLPGQKELNVTEVVNYVVSDVTIDGAVVTATIVSVESDADATDFTGQMMELSQKMLLGQAVQLKVNADGKVVGVKNAEEVKSKALEVSVTLLDKLYESIPGLEQMMPKDNLFNQLAGGFSEEKLAAAYANSSVLSLNGKTVSNGATETVINEQGIKMNRMYFVAGKSIITNDKLNMSKDELKELIIKQMEQRMPEQAEMIKQNIDLVMGQMKFEATVKKTYEMQDNGWVKSIKSESSQDLLGQQTKTVSTVTLKQ